VQLDAFWIGRERDPDDTRGFGANLPWSEYCFAHSAATPSLRSGGMNKLGEG